MAQSDILIDEGYVSAALPARKEDGHKGDFGRLLIIGGAVGFSGAPYLAARAAVRSGCGLVYLGVPQSIYLAVAAKCVSAMPFPLPDSGGMLAVGALGPIEQKLRNCDVLAIGPGLGQSTGVRAVVHTLLRETDKPVVLDADGLNVLSEHLSILDERRDRVTILTPHDGEFARLCALRSDELAARDRVESTREFATAHGCTVVRKGHRTLVALADGLVLENTTGGSALAKGGSGDLLTGLIASLLAQGAPVEPATASAVWLHGLAGDLLEDRLTPYCVTPEDVVDRGLPAAFVSIAE